MSRYQILQGYDAEQVAKEVNALLKDGHTLAGGLVVVYVPTNQAGEQFVYVQAVVKEGE